MHYWKKCQDQFKKFRVHVPVHEIFCMLSKKKDTGCGKLFPFSVEVESTFPSEYLISLFLYLLSLNTWRDIFRILMRAQKACNVLVKDT